MTKTFYNADFALASYIELDCPTFNMLISPSQLHSSHYSLLNYINLTILIPIIQLGEIPTPWSAFSIVSNTELNEEKCDAIKNLLFPALAEGCKIFKSEAEG